MTLICNCRGQESDHLFGPCFRCVERFFLLTHFFQLALEVGDLLLELSIAIIRFLLSGTFGYG